MKTIANTIDWGKVESLVPVVIQDSRSHVVLMLGYMNQEALRKTEQSGNVWFYSRTKQRLWMKGETSGHTLHVVDVKPDCDNDTLLIKVEAQGPTCHTGSVSCFQEAEETGAMQTLFATITSRRQERPAGSYTTTLFDAGLDKISLKVAEESLEVVHAAQKETKERLIEETVDLLYHLFVLLVAKDIQMNHVEAEMNKRSKK